MMGETGLQQAIAALLLFIAATSGASLYFLKRLVDDVETLKDLRIDNAERFTRLETMLDLPPWVNADRRQSDIGRKSGERRHHGG